MANTSPWQKDKGLVPIKVLALSQKHKDFYYNQNNHYQTIAEAYAAWYTHHQTVLQTSNSIYFYCNPWEVDFELPPGAPKTHLDGYLAETQDPLEQLLPNPCNHHQYGSKIIEFHHLGTILLPPIESYHPSVPI